MHDHRTIYRTSGCIEPAPYGLFDDEFVLTNHASKSEFRIRSEELNHLLGGLHHCQHQTRLIPLPELELVKDWNELRGVWGSGEPPTVVRGLSAFIRTLRVLEDHYVEFDAAGSGSGYVAMSRQDLSQLITFLDVAEACQAVVTISEC